jgi:hypothetical protein
MTASGGRFTARLEPLRPCAAVAEGEAARRLARRLLARPDEALARLSGAAGPGMIALLGAEEDLPWSDGVVYLGRDPAAPALLLPTALGPEAPLPLWERAFLAAAAGAAPPLAVLLGPLRAVPLGGARPVQRAVLAAWLAAWPAEASR